MENVKVTVYIVSHNYGKYLMDAIESVLRQTIGGWELLIFNDGSTDNTFEVMTLYKNDPRIRLFHTKGVGLPAVCNMALTESRGKYLIRLDADDIFDENILLILRNHLERDEELALVFPDYFLMDEFGQVFAHERREKIGTSNHLLDAPANGACTLLRKACLIKVGGYREDLGAQDGFDIWTKLIADYKCCNVNLPLFYYRRHQSNLTNQSYRIMNARRTIKKDSIIRELDSFRPFTAVIPCRRNYDFRPDVWNVTVGQKSLLQAAIERCIHSTIFDHIIVASDNLEVEHTVRQYNDPRLKVFHRNTFDTIRSKSLVVTLEKIVKPIDPEFKGVTAVTYLQGFFVQTETLEEAVFTLAMNQADCSIGVMETRDHFLQKTPYGLRTINPKNELRSDFSVIYAETDTSFATRNKNFKTGSLTGPAIVCFLVSLDECIFINSERSLKIANIIQQNNAEEEELKLLRLNTQK